MRHTIVAISGLLCGLVVATYGAWMTYLGTTARTELSILGMKFQSTSVGLTSVFIGATVMIVALRAFNKTGSNKGAKDVGIKQTQMAGSHSQNVQAGRDARVEHIDRKR